MKQEIKNLSLVSTTALALASCSSAPEQPNIVFFMVDDFGWVDSSVAYGEEIYPHNLRHNTPNMQRLAEQSVLMSNAYACPVSTPTRTSIMSGMNAAHTKITNWTSTMKNTPSDAVGGAIAMMNGQIYDAGGDLVRPEWNINGLAPEENIENTQFAVPFPKLLVDAGYYTIHVGKAHWASAGTPGASPYNMGFVVNIAGNVAGMPCSYLSEDYFGNKPDKWNYLAVQNMTEYYGTGTHLTEALTLEAMKTLEYPIAHKQPFYLYMAHYATHTPIMGDPRYTQKYLDMGMDEGQAKYAALVEGVDKSLGDLMDYLERKGVADNTIIIFMTDNGGNSENKQKGGELHTQNLPLREGKGSCYEGGIRVPLMFKWKGHIEPNTRINTPVICEDLYPTILSLAGVKNYEVPQQIDGKDLSKLVTEGSKFVANSQKAGAFSNQYEAYRFEVPESVSGVDPLRGIAFHYPHQWKPYDLIDIDYLTAYRKGDWKIVYRMRTGEVELYNLLDDIGETRNVAGEYPEKTRELAEEYSAQLRAWNAPMPSYRSTGEKVAMPDGNI